MPNPEWHNLAIPMFTALVGYWLGLHRSKHDRLHSFRQSISVLIARLKDSSDEFGFYKEVRETLLVECAKIEGDISKRNLQGFRSACADYFEISEREIKQGLSLICYRLNHGTRTQSGDLIAGPTKHDQRPRKEKMLTALGELRHYGF